jgi:hypothetical protein
MVELSILRMIEILPQLLNIVQIVIYIALSWFFGSLTLRGLKRDFSFFIKIPITLAFGFLCIICGSAFSTFFGLFQEGILKILQIDLFIGGLVISIVFGISLYLMSRESERYDPQSVIKKLKKRIGVLEGLLLERRIQPISEEIARQTAEQSLSGYRTSEARLNKADWEIYLEKGERKAKVVLGAYDGEIKGITYKKSIKDIFSDPLRIIGIVLIVSFLMTSLINFRGLPNISEGVYSLLGISPDDLKSLFGEDENLPEGCISASRLALKYKPSLPTYENEDVKKMIENESGFKIGWMYRISYEGRDYVFAIDLDFKNFCSATETKFCHCVEIPET